MLSSIKVIIMSKSIDFSSNFSDLYINLGIKIGYYRRLRNFTQEQLAEKAGISAKYLSQIEAPGMAVAISLKTLFLIATVLEIPPSKFLEFDDI